MTTPVASLPHGSLSEGRGEAVGRTGKKKQNNTIRAGASVSESDPEKQKKMTKTLQ